MSKSSQGPGSRRRYNDKILGHQEQEQKKNQEFDRIMKEIQSVKENKQNKVSWSVEHGTHYSRIIYYMNMNMCCKHQKK